MLAGSLQRDQYEIVNSLRITLPPPSHIDDISSDDLSHGIVPPPGKLKGVTNRHEGGVHDPDGLRIKSSFL